MSEFNIAPALTLLPAVDVAGGKAVRLTQGEAGSETSYGDPIDAAHEWARQGAQWIHLVDLDAAFDGARWFHFTGITPALGETARRTVAAAAKAAKAAGATVSCDLNFRKKL